MEWKRPVSSDSLINIPCCTRQYWEGQFDAFQKCAHILHNAVDNDLSTKQLKLLANSIESLANQVSVGKLGKNIEGD